ncbi:hypothetical protein LB505_014514 [Fusarium chuoi]|nr:hypothetical protein LB505_014514 [Fusarium chuoi]
MSLISGLQLHVEAIRSAWYGRRPDMATLASLGIMLALIQAVTDTEWISLHGSKIPGSHSDSVYEYPWWPLTQDHPLPAKPGLCISALKSCAYHG